MPDGTCRHCNRPASVCWEPVDERFPARARDVFARAGLEHVATCEAGQAADLERTRVACEGNAAKAWCFDRARRDKGWSGTALTDAQRLGAGLALEG